MREAAAALEGKLAHGTGDVYLRFLEKHGGKWGARAVAALATYKVIQPIAQPWINRARRRDVFTIAVPGTDSIYGDLHEWVLSRIPQVEQKALVIATQGRVYGADENDDGKRVSRRYDGNRVQELTLDGEKVTVAVEKDETSSNTEQRNLSETWKRHSESIVFTAQTARGRDVVIRMIEALVEKRIKDATAAPPLSMPASWGSDWVPRKDLAGRTIESVILKDGQLDRLVNDLQQFMDAESEYKRFEQPWHRGYLFHGEPGTGKTSIARALASHFSLPTYYLPLGDIEKDTDLTNLIGGITPRSVLLIEDVDVFHAATNRDDKATKNASLAGMLNALDGLWTPHGLITIMTTNERRALDPALIRAGRIDVEEEFTRLDLTQAEALAGWFDEDPSMAENFVGQSPADLIASIREQKGVKNGYRPTADPSHCG